MRSVDWLETEGMPDINKVEIVGLETEGEKDTILSELSRLITINGSIQVTDWGSKNTGGVYGREGLSFTEAQRLLYLNGIMDGFMLAENSKYEKEFFSTIKENIDRIQKEFEKEQEKLLA